ncbi:MAG: phenylacetate--CoA ligase family protein [Solirubrobacterales bacterium]
MKIWNRQYECMPREEMEALQLERLKESVQWAYDKVPMYRKKLDEAGVVPQDIQRLSDIRKIPFTWKKELRDYYPYNNFAVPMNEVVRVHASSGTTGKPIVVGYNRHDMEVWTELTARMVTAAGVTEGDIAQVSFGYGLFTGAFGLHYGLERVGATVIPISGGNTERQLMIMKDFEASALICTPTYALHMAEVAQDLGIDPRKDLKVRLGLFGGEAWSEEYRRELNAAWNMNATDNYGLSEIMGPGVAGECELVCGQHIAEDHVLIEIIDSETGNPVEPGQPGEVVITTLTKQTVPMLRYRTRDISQINDAPCECGRHTARMRKVTGRADDMLIIRGVNVFPSQIESVLIDIEGLEPHYQILIRRKGYLDEIEIQVEISPDWFSDKYAELEAVEEKLKHKLASVLLIHPKVRLVEPKSIERVAGKAKRVVDLRGE